MAKRPHPNDDPRGGGYVRSLVVKKAANAHNGGSEGHIADWSAVPSGLLAQFIWAVNVQGNSCLFGQTRNHAILTLTLYSGAEKANWYFDQTREGVDEFCDLASAVIEAALNSPEAQSAPFQGL